MSRPPVTLTTRQTEILGYVALGVPTARIAYLLGCSHGNVTTTITAIGVKLGVSGREQVVTRARELGLVR